MTYRSAPHRLKIWLFCAALLSAQLVLADHAYQHGADHHPASCELCVHGGGDDALSGNLTPDRYPTSAYQSASEAAPEFTGVRSSNTPPIRAPPRF